MERTLILIKPDGVQRGLVGRILQRFEDKGFRLTGAKMIHVTRELAERHYADHKGKDFFEPLVEFITTSPTMAFVLSGVGVVAVARRMLGATFGSQAEPGTIRGDFAISNRYNLTHGSDSPETAEKEIAMFFRPDELFDYPRPIERWVYDDSSGTPF
jgi:nucleoside-diphosphate kinase